MLSSNRGHPWLGSKPGIRFGLLSFERIGCKVEPNESI
jgi:hypothetical protein